MKDDDQRKKYLKHIFGLLTDPIVLTTDSLKPDFKDQKGLRVYTAESYQLSGGTSSHGMKSKSAQSPSGNLKKPDDLAVLMLTSGSSGNPKAVCLQHGQIIHALNGKIKFHQTK